MQKCFYWKINFERITGRQWSKSNRSIKARCKVYHGPYVYNFIEIYNILEKLNISKKVLNYKDLSQKLIEDLKTLKRMKMLTQK